VFYWDRRNSVQNTDEDGDAADIHNCKVSHTSRSVPEYGIIQRYSTFQEQF
jgi:hypothetical protein